MRPIKLTIKAFGPYKDTEIIDFRELKGRNLFLITGPTGSGKTTIFDALSFALYGESSGNERSPESLRSQFAKEDVMTEVSLEFELKGEYYFIKRIPRQFKQKSRGEGLTEQKSDGELIMYGKNPDGDERKVLTGVKAINEKMEELLGISGEQFRQIMMIPQGEFRKLLTSDSQDREKILQKLFDSNIYNLIQGKLDRDFKELHGKMKGIRELISHETSRIDCGDSDPSDSLEELIRSDEDILALLKDEITAIDKRMEQQIAAREKTKENNEKINRKIEIEKNILEKEEMLPEITVLKKKSENAEKALLIAGTYESFTLRRTELAGKEDDLLKIEASIKKEEKRKEELEAILKSENSIEAEALRESYAKDIARLEGYGDKVNKLESIKTSVHDLKKKLEDAENQKKLLSDRLQQGKASLDAAAIRLEDARSSKLMLLKKKEEYTKEESSLKELRRFIDLYLEYCTEKRKYEKAKLDCDSAEENMKLNSNSYKEKKIIFLMNQAANLAMELKSDLPCPVCGSSDHPHPAEFSGGKITEKDIEDSENKMNSSLESYNRKKTAADVLWEKSEILKRELTAIKDILPIYKIDLKSDKNNLEKIYGENLEKLKSLFSEMEIIEKSASMEEKLAADMEKISEGIKKIEDAINDLSEKYLNYRSDFSEQNGLLTSLYQEIPESIRRPEDLKAEIRKFENLKKEAITRLELAKKNYEESNNLLNNLIFQKNEGLKAIEALEKSLASIKSALDGELSSAGFFSVAEYLEARISREEIGALKKNIEDYNNQIHSLREIKKELERTVKDLEYQDLSEIEEAISSIREEKLSAEEKSKTLDGRRKNNEGILKSINKLTEESKSLEKQYSILGSLAKAAKGENRARITFERYVLAAFFEDVIRAANLRLVKMTDGRYQMSRREELERQNKQSGLEVEVYDSYTGKYRHIKTLSGGESFKASLSMALGLSDVVQSYAGGVRLDTMFIDEGFGTLDEESLDSAVNTLIDLQNAGRLVGIISHVQELKERIDVRLEVKGTNEGSYTRFVGL